MADTRDEENPGIPAVRGVDQTPFELLVEAVKGLGARIDDKVLLPEEVREIRRLLPQIQEMLENRRRSQWLWKRIGVFLLAAPAVGVVVQGFIKLLEWIRGQ